jgi:uncharacterized protein (DUF58 family)
VLQGVTLRARAAASSALRGIHRSAAVGVSVDFAEHRAYTPGDDLRHLDWKVLARTNRLYVKRYQQESQLNVLLAVDASGSMAFCSETVPAWRKYDHAVAAAAAVAHLALRQGDQVGLAELLPTARPRQRLSAGRGHGEAILQALARCEPTGQRASEADESVTPPAPDFAALNAQLGQPGLIVVLGDLFAPVSAWEEGLARLHHRGHDVVLLQVLDPAERFFPFRAPTMFRGLEGEAPMAVEPGALRAAYREALQRHQDAIREVARRFGFDHLVMDSSESRGPPLGRLMARRAPRVQQGRGRG